jgi:multidrug resistance protein, MATE family
MRNDLTEVDDSALVGAAVPAEAVTNTERAGLGALLSLAWPLVVSNSFTTVQVTIDRLFLSWYDVDTATAAVLANTLFWLPFALLFPTAGYVATFAAQYTGAGRPLRVGPAVWQGIYFSIIAGLGMLLLLPLSGPIFVLIDHAPAIRELETQFFRCLCWLALPGLLTATVSAFFSGRGQSTVVMAINAIGLVVTAGLDYCLIFGRLGFPEWGLVGAGVATVAGAWASAALGLGLMMRARYRRENATAAGWRFDPPLFRRFLRYGLPSAAQWALDMTAFTAFLVITGWFGTSELGATGLVLTINALAFIPMLGVGQAVAVLVGQRLGEDRPEAAGRITWLGMAVAGGYMGALGLLYILLPTMFIAPFQGGNDPAKWQAIAERVVVLLWFVAAFSVFDAANIVLSFGLRGAGDTVFVSLVSLFLAWPVMVVPTWLAWKYGWGLYWAWGFATVYICLQAACFFVRFRGGKWKTMRVIEPVLIERT